MSSAFLLLTTLVLSLHHSSAQADVALDDQPSLIPSTKAVALVIHGINHRPERMDPMASLLRDQGVHVVRASLTGHHSNRSLDDFLDVTADQWLEDAWMAYLYARSLAYQKQVPLYFLGFSLGALTMLTLQNTHPELDIAFDRMILVAPALALPFYAYWSRALFLQSRMIIPSISSFLVKLHRGISVSAYRALFELIERLNQSQYKFSRNSKIETLLIMNPADNLVSFSKVQRVLSKNDLTQWQTLTVSTEHCTLSYCSPHHITEEGAVGTDEWKRISGKIRLKIQ